MPPSFILQNFRRE